MNTKCVQLLARYNQRTNEDMNRFVAQLSADQWRRQFDGYYRSVHSLCNHLFVSDFNWLRRCGNLRAFNYLKDGSFPAELPLTATACESQADYLGKRGHLDAKFLELASEASQEDLDKTLAYKTSKGVPQERWFGGVLLYVFNHQTHHRGMISIYLESLGIANDYSSLLGLV